MQTSLPEFHSSSLDGLSAGTSLGGVLTRHEGEFRLDQDKALDLDELLLLLGSKESAGDRSREDAIACYLSASEGWRDASKLLGGTCAQRSVGLRERKED